MTEMSRASLFHSSSVTVYDGSAKGSKQSGKIYCNFHLIYSHIHHYVYTVHKYYYRSAIWELLILVLEKTNVEQLKACGKSPKHVFYFGFKKSGYVMIL